MKFAQDEEPVILILLN